MEKEQLNDKVDKETTLSAIKASYINSYKVIVADVTIALYRYHA